MRSIAILISFGVGLLSLSQEIVWVRILSFSQQGRPHAFALVLVVFLIGIAIGSYLGRAVCQRSLHVLRSAGWALVAAAVSDLVSIGVCTTGVATNLGSPRRLAAILMLVCAGAALKGVLFPIVHHLGTDNTEDHVGRSVSYVYLANVLGSTVGPIVTGFWLLDVWPVEKVFVLISIGTVSLGILALWTSRGEVRSLAWLAPAAVLVLGVGWLAVPPAIIAGIAASTTTSPGDNSRTTIRDLVQNKHGVIHVTTEDRPGPGSITYGGNVYDGRRWLRAHPDARYDLVIENTTFHWRAYATRLLSREHLTELKTHLNEGGIVAVNTTGNVDAYLTAEVIYRHVARYRNFVYMSDSPLSKRADAEAVLRASAIWGRPAFADALFAPGKIGAVLAHEPLEPADAFLRRVAENRPPWIITDLNMVTEYRHGEPPPFGWLSVFLPADAGPMIH